MKENYGFIKLTDSQGSEILVNVRSIMKHFDCSMLGYMPGNTQITLLDSSTIYVNESEAVVYNKIKSIVS